jgi:site-specific recombinase XerD
MASIISLTERARQRAAAARTEADAAFSAAQRIAARPDVPTRRLALPAAISTFVKHLYTRELSPRTIEGHEYELERFTRWLEEQEIDWQHITLSEMSAYASTRAHLKFSSKAALMVTMRQFYMWAEREELVVISPARQLVTPTRPAPVPRAMNADQVRKLLSHLALHREDSLKSRRDEAMLLTGLYQGMRAAELAGAMWEQLDLQRRILVIPISKMARGRTMKIHPDLVPILHAWREAQGADGDDKVAVFRIIGGKIVPNRVGKIAYHYATLLQLPLTAHTLRHTFATWSLRRSGNLYAVSKALGHKHLTQTEIYLRSDPSDSAPAIEAMPSRDDW